MALDELELRLSRMVTHWTLLRRAHDHTPEARSALESLVERYRPAVHRYLLAVLRDANAADDLTQEFCLKLVRGDFRGATPERGRFRNYVKSVLFHLVSAHRRRAFVALNQDADPPIDEAEELDFDATWREELLSRVWNALRRRRPLYHAVLRFHADHPHLPSVAMAHFVSQETGVPMSGATARQKLHRARTLFARLLLDEMAHSLDHPTPERIEEELRDLGLWDYFLVQEAAKA